jgi:hydroxymethylpyrimidine pyrophosphatase-like HAD family hydrolase
VTTNGAILLIDGQIDRQWQEESQEAVLPWREALEEALRALCLQPQAKRYRMVDEMFVFAACDNREDALALHQALHDTTPLQVEVTGRKVYFFPPPVNKGAVIPKLRRRFQAGRIVCAGDSCIDIPMLQQADVSIVPDQEGINGISCRQKVICPPSERFYDFVLRQAEAYTR